MKRYFQHLNVNDDNCGMVTELDFIDNSDPTFILYHFNTVKVKCKCIKRPFMYQQFLRTCILKTGIGSMKMKWWLHMIYALVGKSVGYSPNDCSGKNAYHALLRV